MLDQQIAVWIGLMKSLQEGGVIEYPFAGDCLIQMGHQVVAHTNIFGVPDRGDRSEAIKNLVQPLGAIERLMD